MFEYLQGKSQSFPAVDNFAFFEYFIKPSEILDWGDVKRADIENILIKARFDTKEELRSAKN